MRSGGLQLPRTLPTGQPRPAPTAAVPPTGVGEMQFQVAGRGRPMLCGIPSPHWTAAWPPADTPSLGKPELLSSLHLGWFCVGDPSGWGRKAEAAPDNSPSSNSGCSQPQLRDMEAQIWVTRQPWMTGGHARPVSVCMGHTCEGIPVQTPVGSHGCPLLLRVPFCLLSLAFKGKSGPWLGRGVGTPCWPHWLVPALNLAKGPAHALPSARSPCSLPVVAGIWTLGQGTGALRHCCDPGPSYPGPEAGASLTGTVASAVPPRRSSNSSD